MCHQCNKCQQCQPYCQCDNSTTYDPCARNQKCIQKVDAECVVYELNNPNGLSELKCLKLPTTTNLKQFMIAVDRKFCQLSADVYVKVSEDDKTNGYLSEKLLVGQCMKLVKKDHNGGKALSVELDFDCLCKYIKANCGISGCVTIGDEDLPIPVPIPVVIPTPVPLPICMPVVQPIPLPVVVPTPTPVPIPVVQPLPVPLPVVVPTPVIQPVPVPVIVPTPVVVPVPVVLPVPVPIVAPVPVPVVAPTPIPIPVPVVAPIPQPLPVPVPVVAPVPVPIIAPVPQPIHTPVPVPVVAPVPVPVLVPTPTPVPVPQPTPNPIPTPVPVPQPVPVPVEIPQPVPIPVPVEIPQPVPVPVPVPVLVAIAWNLTLCSDGSNATIQVDNINLSSGVIIKDDNTGICYTVVNLNPVQFNLMGQHSEYTDCASCIGVPTPIPQPVPVPVPVEIPVPTPVPVPVPVQLVWNLQLCSDGSNATYQLDDNNLASGVVIFANDTQQCYTLVNQGPIVVPLLTSYQEEIDCASCLSSHLPVPIPIPVPVPVPVSATPAAPVSSTDIVTGCIGDSVLINITGYAIGNTISISNNGVEINNGVSVAALYQYSYTITSFPVNITATATNGFGTSGDSNTSPVSQSSFCL